MLYKELKSEEDFYKLNLRNDVDVFNYLVENYGDESAEALNDFVEIEMELGCFSDDDLKLFFEIYEYGELIEWIDDYIDDEVLVNYFVKDYCLTDLGVWDMVVENGYLVV